MNSSQARLTNTYLKTPKAAAFAGIIFSILLFAVFGLMRRSVPPDPSEQGAFALTTGPWARLVGYFRLQLQN